MRGVGIWRDRRGFTAMELIIVMVILGIMAMLSYPSIRTALLQLRINSATRELAGAARQAQSEAVRRGGQARLVVCDRVGGNPDGSSGCAAAFANQYRIQWHSTTVWNANWPALAGPANPNPGAGVTNTNISPLSNIPVSYTGVVVLPGNGVTVVFNPNGSTAAPAGNATLRMTNNAANVSGSMNGIVSVTTSGRLTTALNRVP